MTALTHTTPSSTPLPQQEDVTPERCPVSTKKTVTLFRDVPLLLDCGQPLNHVRVAYHTYGTPRAEATVVLHALTGSSAVHEWWADFLGEGRPLDPTRDYIVCANVLGGCYGTTGPAELPLVNGEAAPVTLRDMARVGRALLEYLGVKKVRLIGSSMGGMLAYAWLLECPDLVERAVVIGAPTRHSPWAIGWNTAARNAIRAAPGGEGLKVARQIAMLSYRSQPSFEQTQQGQRRPGVPAITTYLEYQGEKLLERFCERTYVTLTQAMDAFQPSDAELRTITAPVLAVGISSDVLYPAQEVRERAAALPNSTYWELSSIHGHDAFLMDAQELPQVVRDFLHA